MKVSFLGLGVMGYPMAGHLAASGVDVCVYNRSLEKATSWAAENKGRVAPTPKQAAKGADVVFCCVGNDDDLRDVFLGDDGALAGMKPGAIFVDHTTTSAKVARELAVLARSQQVEFMDAPVPGGQAGAQTGLLPVMYGGKPEVYETIKPLLLFYSKSSSLLGKVGAGQLTKMVNQICIAGVVQGLAEAMHFATTVGLDSKEVIDVISHGAAQSWQMENRHETMIEGEYEHGFAVDWMRKDLGIVLDEAKEQGVTLALTALVDQFYADVQRAGGGRWDTSALLARLQHIDAIEY